MSEARWWTVPEIRDVVRWHTEDKLTPREIAPLVNRSTDAVRWKLAKQGKLRGPGDPPMPTDSALDAAKAALRREIDLARRESFFAKPYKGPVAW